MPSLACSFLSGSLGRVDVETVRYLLRFADIDLSGPWNEPLRTACFKGFTEIVKLLLADERIDRSSTGGSSALRLAISHKHLEIVKLLLKDERVSIDKPYAIFDIITNNDVSMMTLLYEGLGISAGSHSLRIACERGYTQMVELLLTDPEIDPAEKDNYAIKVAANNRYIDIVKLLLRCKSVDPSAYSNFALKVAAENKDRPMVNLLLAQEKVREKMSTREIKLCLQMVG